MFRRIQLRPALIRQWPSHPRHALPSIRWRKDRGQAQKNGVDLPIELQPQLKAAKALSIRGAEA
jgi:hypothetical protein